MRVNSIQLNNYYTKNNKINREISFTNNSPSDYPRMTQFEKNINLPKKVVQQTSIKTALLDLASAVKAFFKSTTNSGTNSGSILTKSQMDDYINLIPYLV